MRPYSRHCILTGLAASVASPSKCVVDASEATTLSLNAHFIPTGGGRTQLESMPVEARSVRNAPSLNATPSSSPLKRDGWAWMSGHTAVESLVSSIHHSCLDWKDWTTDDSGTGGDAKLSVECVRSYLEEHKRDRLVNDALSALQSYLEGTLLPPGLTATCHGSDQVVVFSRRSDDPQNMHYDTVAAERDANCTATTTQSGSDRLNIRVWLPLAKVVDSPLLLSNTTWLYPDACSRRHSAPETPMSAEVSLSSLSWRIFSRREFEDDCRFGTDGSSEACSFYHTLGMLPGEALYFRNGDVMHGTADFGAGRRTSIAVDCVTFQHDEQMLSDLEYEALVVDALLDDEEDSNAPDE